MLFSFLLTSLLTFLPLISAVAVGSPTSGNLLQTELISTADHAPRGTFDIVHTKQTNARRFAIGLPPLPPKRRTTKARRSTVSSVPTIGNFKIYTEGGASGYFSSDINPLFVGSSSGALQVQLIPSGSSGYSKIQTTDGLNLNCVPEFSTPYPGTKYASYLQLRTVWNSGGLVKVSPTGVVTFYWFNPKQAAFVLEGVRSGSTIKLVPSAESYIEANPGYERITLMIE